MIDEERPNINNYSSFCEEQNNYESFDSISFLLNKKPNYLCRECLKFPTFIILLNEKIKLFCDCNNSGQEIKELNIKEAFSHLTIGSNKDNIDYKSICSKHNNADFSYYCTKCKINLCTKCSYNCYDKGHELLNIIYDKNNTRKKALNLLIEIKQKLKIKNINDIDDIFDNLKIIENIKIVRDENNSLIKINSFNELNLQYYLLFFYIIIHDYMNYPNYNHIINISYICLYLKVFDNNPLNELNLKYKNNNNNIRILGDEFVKNNKDNCYLIINNKEMMELQKDINIMYINDNSNLYTFDIKLIKIKKITDMSYMFKDCSSLISVSDLSNWVTPDITNISYMFYNCSYLKSIPYISQWDTSNIKDMSYLFHGCSDLCNLPNISKWNTKNVINMKNLFSDCHSLETIPDISKWNTINVIDISYMFCSCSSLKFIPNISNFNTSNLKNIEHIFDYCPLVKTFPDTSKWKVNNLVNGSITYYLSSLLNFIKGSNNFNENKKIFNDLFLSLKKYLKINKLFTIFIIFILIIIIILLRRIIYIIFCSLFLPYYYIYIALFLKRSDLYMDDVFSYEYFTIINKGNEYLTKKIYIGIINAISSLTYKDTLLLFIPQFNNKFHSLFWVIFFCVLNTITIIIDYYDKIIFQELKNSFEHFYTNIFDDDDMPKENITYFEDGYIFAIFNMCICCFYYFLIILIYKRKQIKNEGISFNNDYKNERLIIENGDDVSNKGYIE